jgi:uncharacterized phage-associated protein
MPETTASGAANFIIQHSQAHGDGVSNLKLQKLLYYAQAWYLALNGKPLFAEDIEAWVHGPVVPAVYGDFKKYAWNLIPAPQPPISLSAKVSGHIQDVILAYGHLSAYQLETLTHTEKPWLKARNGIPNDKVSHAVISHTDMRDFYRSKLKSDEKD